MERIEARVNENFEAVIGRPVPPELERDLHEIVLGAARRLTEANLDRMAEEELEKRIQEKHEWRINEEVGRRVDAYIEAREREEKGQEA